MTQIAFLAFDGFNEIDIFLAFHILSRVKQPDWRVQITGPTATLVSMNNVSIQAQQPLSFLESADAVLIGSGNKTRQVVQDDSLMSQIKLNPARQLIATQCSGAILLYALGLAPKNITTDLSSADYFHAQNVPVLSQSFVCQGKIVSAGGCLAATYLAAWLMLELLNPIEAERALRYAAPIDQLEQWPLDVINHVQAIQTGTVLF